MDKITSQQVQDLQLQVGVALTNIHRLEQQVQDLQDKATGQEDKDLVTLYANDKPYQVDIGVGKTESFQSDIKTNSQAKELIKKTFLTFTKF